jgi:hypothetical protein
MYSPLEIGIRLHQGIRLCPTIDLAVGHGRNSGVLSTPAEPRIMEIETRNLEIRKRRFPVESIKFLVNKEFDLQPVRDGDVIGLVGGRTS